MSPDYSRQQLLKEIGAGGQEKLTASRVLIVGAGGLGSPVLQYLAGAGVGHLGVADADTLDASNLHRQPIYALADVGKSKVQLARAAVQAINPSVIVETHAERFTADNALELVRAYDIAVDCSDNFRTKFLINDAAVLARRPAVFASVYQYEGQLQVYKPEPEHACLRCLWPDATADGMVGNCAEIGVLGPVPGIFGSLQALVTLKILLAMPGQLGGELLLLDFTSFSSVKLKAPRRRACGAPHCALIRDIPREDTGIEISLPSLDAASAERFEIIDIRSAEEVAAQPEKPRHIAMPALLANPELLSRAGRYVLVCASGKRSLATARELRKRGFDVRSLAGGYQALHGADGRPAPLNIAPVPPIPAPYEPSIMRFDSKLPDVGTTIFTVMSRRAAEENALNIGQGFPDYPIDPRLSQSLVETIAEGRNQYAPMEGVVELRERIAAKLQSSYAIEVDPLTEVTVTCGGTEALYDAIQAVVRMGDEVIIFDPAYDAYEPAVRLAGGRSLRVPLIPPEFRFDWDRVRGLLSDRTRLIIINSPQNPSCSVANSSDLDALAGLVRDRPISILADEVYEHVLYDGRRHASVLSHAELRARSFAVFSFGKTLHATGWRVGYCVAPPAMTRELRKVHQFNTFSIASPLQYAIARYLSRQPDAWTGLAAFFQAKRDLLAGLLHGSGFEPVPAAGTYFQLVDYGALSRSVDTDFADRLIREAKVATIPLSPFYETPPTMTLLRLCIAKRDETLEAAANRLRRFARALA